MLGGMISASPSLSPGQVAGRSLDTVCFFVLCKRHWIKGPGGAPWGFPMYTLHLNSDAGYAVSPRDHHVSDWTLTWHRCGCPCIQTQSIFFWVAAVAELKKA